VKVEDDDVGVFLRPIHDGRQEGVGIAGVDTVKARLSKEADNHHLLGAIGFFRGLAAEGIGAPAPAGISLGEIGRPEKVVSLGHVFLNILLEIYLVPGGDHVYPELS
jgi:hypothetical protein